MLPLKISNNHFPIRLLTPSTPNPHLGHPKPWAMVGGTASGNDAAEKNVMPKEGMGGLFAGGRRISVARETFSGMERKDGTSYLYVGFEPMRISISQRSRRTHQSWVRTRVFLQSQEKPYFSLSGQIVGWIPRPSRPPSQPLPSPPNRLNMMTLPLTSPSVGILFFKNHISTPPGPENISSWTNLEKL